MLGIASMMLIPSNSLDVIERISSVTEVALVDLGVLLTGDHPVHHDKVPHIVAWRRLMALRAIL
ncbi:hypothetical protein ES707_05817 [subsurface metagenome]